MNVGLCSLGYTGTVSAGGSQTVVEHQDGNSLKPIVKASATVPAVSGNVAFNVQCLGVTVAAFELDFSLGRTMAETNFSVPGA